MSNRLANTTSPYLRQHAENPVEWYPWGDEALRRAAEEGKPILLSIGYSACHWCHVMAHESFEHPATAALMNEHFINIKVDREERPDLDRIYQLAHQLLNRSGGGWPLTIFLTPEGRQPFFSGTYFPPRPRQGQPAFSQILLAVAKAHNEQRATIDEQAHQVAAALSQQVPVPPDGQRPQPTLELIERAIERIAERFDRIEGGFGPAPKFPGTETLQLLLAHARTHGDAASLQMAEHTLNRMALGGIHDHVGGGFCRYSVDARWMIPHFEKMLYDNGVLLCAYSDLWRSTRNPLHEWAARGVAQWVMEEMQSPEGGYYSSLDADSEGEEGLYYLWTPEQVKSVLSEDEQAAFCAAHGLDSPANFEGRWHLNRLDQPEAAVGTLFPKATAKLRRERAKRIHPARDEKQLTAWNALMIRGMARAAATLGEERYRTSADRALTFIRNQLWQHGRLQAVHSRGESAFNAYLDDYVFLLDALWEMLQLRWRSSELDWALELIEILFDHFADPVGGFFFTSDDHEALILRPKPLMDDATPSGNGVAVQLLARFGYLMGEGRYLDAAERTLTASWSRIAEYPHAHCTLLQGLAELYQPSPTLILRAPAAEIELLRVETRNRVDEEITLFAIPNEVSDLHPAIATKGATTEPTWYLCSGSHCHPPVHDHHTLRQQIGELRDAASSDSPYGAR